jgi:hypothetical protein
MLGADESDIFLCDTVMGEYDWPTMVVRRFEKNTVFVSVIEPFEDTPKISDVSVIPVRGSCNIFAAVKISFTDSSRADYFMLAGSGGVSREFSDFETESKACYVRTDFGTVTAIHHID